jgi:hypothetical protein
MKKVLAILVAGLMAGAAYAAIETVRLDSLESAAYGASYMQIIEYDDLTPFGALTNATVGITSAVPAKVGLTMAGMILEVAFQDGANSGANATTNSITVAIGDGSDADYFLTATEVAADGTEVFVQFSPVASGAIAITPQTVSVTNNGGSPAVVVMTNATAAFTGSRLGAKYYASAGVVVYTFATAGDTILGNLQTGRLKVYWRELK